MARLLSVNVGLPKDVGWQGRTVRTGIWKSPVTGPRMVRRRNVDGDGQGDLGGHGGEQRAVMVYQIDSYAHWQKHFDRQDLEYGNFGENFTVDGLADDEVCIGDRYRIGTAEFEVTQPRVTCYRVGMRLGEPTMPALLVAHHRPGFYLRVITEGLVEAGDEIVRTRIGPHALSVADIDALLYLPGRDPARLRAAVDIPALSPGWQQSFHELLDAAEAGHRPDTPPVGTEPLGWAGFRRLRVTRRVAETATVASLYLEAEDGTRLPAPRAGQFLTVRVPGAGDPAPVRSYSLSSDPAAGVYRISVKRESRGSVSTYLNTRLAPGSELDVAAPRGDFVLADDDRPVLLISAGIGATPVLAMLHRLADQHTDRQVWWIHTAREPGQRPFADESHRLVDALPDGREHIFYTARGDRLTRAALDGLKVPANATAYVCGPASFMTDMRDALTGLGLDAGRVHFELFGALPPINPGLTGVVHRDPHPPSGPPGTGPLVTFVRSGLSVRWPENSRSLLDLAEGCDVQTRWSCRTGVCHTCVTPVLAGGVDYAPEPLERPAVGEVLICCSRPSGDLVLDL
jgi:ferredoxin-NADP reductase/MOSC domain-containing protein YiiM